MSVSIIRLASDTSKALSTPTAVPVNGSPVEIGSASTLRSSWDIQEDGGVVRIASMRAGKLISASDEVTLAGYGAETSQEWRMVDTGSTVEYEGETYSVYSFALDSDPSQYLAAGSSRAVLGSQTGFILTPATLYENGGVYELKTMLDPSMVVAGIGYTPVKGANIALFGNNDGNNRKWLLVQDGQGRWRFRNVATGLYMTLGVNVPVQGANVRQWTSSANAIQYWNLIETGETVNLDGYECSVVRIGNYYTSAGDTWMLDVDGALTSSNSNMEVNRSSSSESQKFALFPVTPLNNSVPAPANVAIASSIGGDPMQALPSQGTVYPSWDVPTAWASTSSNHSEWRWRSRELGAENVWGEWSDFGIWTPAAVVVENGRAWEINGLPGTFQGKALQYQLQVRSVAVGASENLHSPASASVVQVDFAPIVSISSIEWTMEGMRVDYSSDYPYGMLDFIFTIEADGETLIEDYQTGFVDPSGSLIIPNGVVRAFPSDGSTADITLAVSTDMRRQTGSQSLTAPITVGSGGLDLQLTAGDVQGYGGLPVTANMECDLVLVCDGETYQLGKGTSWEVLFPYGPFEVRGYAQEGTRWGVASLKYSEPPTDKRAHGWLVDGSVRALETRESGGTEESKTLTASSQNFSYAGRKREAVFFGSVTVVQMPVTGLIVEGVTGTSWEDLETMVGRRGLYRAPYGGLHKVAVTGMQKDRTLKRTNVTVNQDEVDQ